jgi:hypothetical protein
MNGCGAAEGMVGRALRKPKPSKKNTAAPINGQSLASLLSFVQSKR